MIILLKVKHAEVGSLKPTRSSQAKKYSSLDSGLLDTQVHFWVLFNSIGSFSIFQNKCQFQLNILSEFTHFSDINIAMWAIWLYN